MSHLVQRYYLCSGPHSVWPWEGPVTSRPLVCSAHTLWDRTRQYTIPGHCQPYGIGPMGYSRSGIARHCRSSRCPCSETSDTVVPLATLQDRKSTRLNSSHLGISYAVFCLKKKKQQKKNK